MHRVSTVPATLAVIGAGLCAASAEVVTHPSGTRVQYSDWTFVAIIHDLGDTATVPGVLALRDKANATGDNIVSIWYENPGNCSGWTAKAWTSQDQAEAIKYVKDMYGISDQYDFMWPTPDQVTIATISSTPTEYQAGLLVADPLFVVAASDASGQVVSALTAVGYQAAAVPIEQASSTCHLDDMLCGFAATMASAASLPQLTSDEIDVKLATSIPTACLAQATPPGGGGGGGGGTPWTPPGTAVNPPPSPMWVTPPNSLPYYDSACSTTVSCCYTTEIRYYYWDYNWLNVYRMYYCESTYSWNCPNPAIGPAPRPRPARRQGRTARHPAPHLHVATVIRSPNGRPTIGSPRSAYTRLRAL